MAFFHADGRLRLHSHPTAFTPHAAPCEGGALADPRCCSMEVDYSPLDERKEGGDGALVQVDDSGDGGSTDSSIMVQVSSHHQSRAVRR